MSDLAKKKCTPCSGGVPPLAQKEKEILLKELDSGWSLKEDQSQIYREFKFKNYKNAWKLLNHISEVAEEEGHHPDLKLGWGYLHITILTHKIQNLVEADFIFAAKVDHLTEKFQDVLK